MIKGLSCILAGMCLMFSTSACTLGRGIEAFDQDKIVLLQTEDLMNGEDIAVVETSEGTFKMRFFPSEAPQTVENFIGLAQLGYYDGQMVSKVEKMEKSGYTKGRLIAGSGKPANQPGETIIEREIRPEISYNLGTIPGAVVAYTPNDVVDSRFYIVSSCEVPKEELDEIERNNYPKQLVELFRQCGGYPEDWLHRSVFAQVIDGMDVVDKMIEQNPNTAEGEVTDIEIIRITIEKYQEPSKQENGQ